LRFRLSEPPLPTHNYRFELCVSADVSGRGAVFTPFDGRRAHLARVERSERSRQVHALSDTYRPAVAVRRAMELGGLRDDP